MNNLTDEQKIKRFDAAYKLLYDLCFKAPECRPPNGQTIEILGDMICNGDGLQ